MNVCRCHATVLVNSSQKTINTLPMTATFYSCYMNNEWKCDDFFLLFSENFFLFCFVALQKTTIFDQLIFEMNLLPARKKWDRNEFNHKKQSWWNQMQLKQKKVMWKQKGTKIRRNRFLEMCLLNFFLFLKVYYINGSLARWNYCQWYL